MGHEFQQRVNECDRDFPWMYTCVIGIVFLEQSWDLSKNPPKSQSLAVLTSRLFCLCSVYIVRTTYTIFANTVLFSSSSSSWQFSSNYSSPPQLQPDCSHYRGYTCEHKLAQFYMYLIRAVVMNPSSVVRAGGSAENHNETYVLFGCRYHFRRPFFCSPVHLLFIVVRMWFLAFYFIYILLNVLPKAFRH